jgi:hypothetical protein
VVAVPPDGRPPVDRSRPEPAGAGDRCVNAGDCAGRRSAPSRESAPAPPGTAVPARSVSVTVIAGPPSVYRVVSPPDTPLPAWSVLSTVGARTPGARWVNVGPVSRPTAPRVPGGGVTLCADAARVRTDGAVSPVGGVELSTDPATPSGSATTGTRLAVPSITRVTVSPPRRPDEALSPTLCEGTASVGVDRAPSSTDRAAGLLAGAAGSPGSVATGSPSTVLSATRAGVSSFPDRPGPVELRSVSAVGRGRSALVAVSLVAALFVATWRVSTGPGERWVNAGGVSASPGSRTLQGRRAPPVSDCASAPVVAPAGPGPGAAPTAGTGSVRRPGGPVTGAGTGLPVSADRPAGSCPAADPSARSGPGDRWVNVGPLSGSTAPLPPDRDRLSDRRWTVATSGSGTAPGPSLAGLSVETVVWSASVPPGVRVGRPPSANSPPGDPPCPLCSVPPSER